jgi:hypothetical protein
MLALGVPAWAGGMLQRVLVVAHVGTTGALAGSQRRRSAVAGGVQTACGASGVLRVGPRRMFCRLRYTVACVCSCWEWGRGHLGQSECLPACWVGWLLLDGWMDGWMDVVDYEVMGRMGGVGVKIN